MATSRFASWLFALVFIIIFWIGSVDAFFNTNLRRSLQDNETAACEPNEDLTGLICSNVTLYQANFSGELLTLKVTLNQTFHVDARETSTEVWAWFSFKEQQDVLWANFSFNSSTPNNTWHFWATHPVGEVTIPTGNASWPELSLQANATFNVTLYKLDYANCTDLVNGSFCDEGYIHAALSVKAWGEEETAEGDPVWVSLDQADAGGATIWFETHINETAYCSEYSKQVQWADEYTFKLDFCAAENTTGCGTIEHTFNTSTWEEPRVTFADYVCFEPSFDISA